MRKWGWLFRGLMGLAAAVTVGVAPVRAADFGFKTLTGEAQVEQYLQAFLQMTLWYDRGYGTKAEQRPFIYKLGRTLRVRISASGYEEYTRNWLRDFGGMTGLDVVFLAPDDESETLFIEIQHAVNPLTPQSPCYTVSDLGTERQRRGHVLMDPLAVTKNLRHSTAGFFGCINHETMHSLGFGHDHDHPTVMSYAYSQWFLTDLDKMMIRTLYDTRMKSGMRWIQALAIARDIVTDNMIADGAPPETKQMGRRWVAQLVDFMTNEANAGNLMLQAQLGWAYTFGDATDYLPKDPALGYAWLLRSAEAGVRDAQASVGISLMYGRGVAENPTEALKWLRASADKGHAGAQYNLGLAYRDGKGLPADQMQAYRWMASAADRGLGIASGALRQFKPTLTTEQFAAVSRRAENGDTFAQYHLGLYYTNTVPSADPAKDLPQGYAWFKRAAEAGMREAQTSLGYSLITGRGVAENPAEAIRWLKLAANRGHNGAAYGLALAYRDGKGAPQNLVEAYRWMAAAADRDMPQAKTELAAMESTMSGAQLAKAQAEIDEVHAREELRAGQQLASATPRPGTVPDKPAAQEPIWKPVKRVLPPYPADAAARGVTGRVILMAEIGIDGLPHNVQVAESTGQADLDAEGVKALEQWRFEAKIPVTAEFRFLFRPGPPPTEEEAWR